MPRKSKPRGPDDKCKTTFIDDCSSCPAMCCHDLSINIKKPRNLGQIAELKWQLNYENVGIYVRNLRWHLIIKSKCRYLGDDNLCTIYEERDEVCRDHKPPYCERYADWYDIMFTTAEELDAYLTAERRGKRKPKPKGKWISKGTPALK